MLLRPSRNIDGRFSCRQNGSNGRLIRESVAVRAEDFVLDGATGPRRRKGFHIPFGAALGEVRPKGISQVEGGAKDAVIRSVPDIANVQVSYQESAVEGTA